MIDLILPYLFGTLATAVVLFLSAFNYLRGKKERQAYERERALLPDAVRLEKLEELRQRAEDDYEKIQQDLSDARILIAERSDAETWLNVNREKLLNLKAEREEQESLRNSLEMLQKKTLEYNQQINDQQANVAKIKAELGYWDKVKDQKDAELQKLDEAQERLKERKSQLEADLQPLQNRIAGIQSEMDSRQSELDLISSQMERRIQQYEQQIKQIQELTANSEKRLNQVKEQVENETLALHAAREERSRISADVQALQREKVALEDLIKNLRKDWNTVLRLTGQDEGADDRRTQELWAPYISKKASEFNLVQDRTELDQLSKTEDYLRSQHLYFPRRVLWAFHASLKVTDISPLVVLAGISGTGKSELPRRYAEAMGIHFLNVAVQPRWDSPQDMFGFFNYLESRYRATELGRALVQMDPFYNEEGRGWTPPDAWDHSLSSQMMLVLLDEMNLARVEYYFSEFLSRLETRRGVNLLDPQSRRKAEIGLEVGSGRSTSPIMQLFVDRNVLFVGTMNEDETTQALSDKVIDRANVLRFGRPGNIDQERFIGKKIEIDTRLQYADWMSWCKSPEALSEDLKSTVNNYVNRLDDAMSQIKRPFGFRTRNGIMSYVANYPSRDADAVDDAIADQIEQKILPKFRGLDPRDHDVKSALNKVRSILSDLRDELLVEAIDRTAKESQFIWLGVNRFQEELAEDPAVRSF